MKKLISLVLILCLAVPSFVSAETVLPELSSVFEVTMPSLRHCAKADPVNEETTEDGGKLLTFEGITEDIYNDFNRYLGEWGCTLSSLSVSGNTMTAILARENAFFIFAYNYETQQAVVTYPDRTREETVDAETQGRIGSYVTFGTYPQGTGDEAQPIEWQVLDAQGDKMLLISRYALDCKPYNKTYADSTWESCTLRSWLNNDFYSRAFSEEEQGRIVTVSVLTDRNPDYSTDPGETTQDKIFLLSIQEINKYFISEEDRMCVPTAYAKARNAYLCSFYTVNDEATCWWWLRSPGSSAGMAAGIFGGNVYGYGDYVNDETGCVRPALWITADASL